MSDFQIPIIRLEFEHMKYTLQTALVRHSEEMSRIINDAVDRFFSKENIDAVIQEQLNLEIQRIFETQIKYALTDAMRDVFYSDDGATPLIKKIVANNVNNRLKTILKKKRGQNK